MDGGVFALGHAYLFITCQFVHARILEEKRGVVAIQSTGISSIQALGGIILLGVFISLGCGWLSSIHITEGDDDQFSQNRPLRMKIGDERIWYFKDFNSSSLCGSQVQLFCYGDKGEDVMRIRAERACWSAENGWSFQNGRFLGFYGIGGLPVLSKNEQSIVWEKISSENNTSLADTSLKVQDLINRLKSISCRD